MNYVPVHTSIYPSYNYLLAENSFIKQSSEYKDHVLCEQSVTITNLKKDIEQLSVANMKFKEERDRFAADAERWRVMQKIIKIQGGEQHLYEVQKIVDKDIERERNRKGNSE